MDFVREFGLWWGWGFARPPPFTLSTSMRNVMVYASAERADALLLFLLYSFLLCGSVKWPYYCIVQGIMALEEVSCSFAVVLFGSNPPPMSAVTVPCFPLLVFSSFCVAGLALPLQAWGTKSPLPIYSFCNCKEPGSREINKTRFDYHAAAWV